MGGILVMNIVNSGMKRKNIQMTFSTAVLDFRSEKHELGIDNLPDVTLNARQNSLRSNAGFINRSLTMDAT
jgi:hypothetical protein